MIVRRLLGLGEAISMGVHRQINPSGIVPAGPDVAGWRTPHGREELGARPFGNGTPPGPPQAGERVPPIG